jgi:predicted DCC family thiol-disulfide oxidoreductase YuxK
MRLPALRGLGELLRLPGAMGLARPLYALVARNRYLLGGRADACEDDICG